MAHLYNKKKLMEDLDKLPGYAIQEILDFAEFITSRRVKTEKKIKGKKLDPKKDPILKLMGIVDIEPFSDKIDQEL
ncbi:MAG TPA: hypothetical protein ENH52_14945, partial [Nitrospirae bacterium]|nr:hypothetical protein [Nitrospirota bacterium]HDZ02715.1 hypothetical protein [Nitrospirota bacterium]